jgi:hypothetical protein
MIVVITETLLFGNSIQTNAPTGDDGKGFGGKT